MACRPLGESIGFGIFQLAQIAFEIGLGHVQRLVALGDREWPLKAPTVSLRVTSSDLVSPAWNCKYISNMGSVNTYECVLRHEFAHCHVTSFCSTDVTVLGKRPLREIIPCVYRLRNFMSSKLSTRMSFGISLFGSHIPGWNINPILKPGSRHSSIFYGEVRKSNHILGKSTSNKYWAKYVWKSRLITAV